MRLLTLLSSHLSDPGIFHGALAGAVAAACAQAFADWLQMPVFAECMLGIVVYFHLLHCLRNTH